MKPWRVFWILALVVATMLCAFYFAPPAEASAVRYVYVEDHTGSAWPVTRVEPWVDQFTGSTMIYGRCRAGYKCIRVYERVVRNEWAAVTRNATTATVTIYVNPQRNWYPYGWRFAILAHELVHANGFYWHTSYCSLMYYAVKCPNGTVSTWVSPWIRSVLAKN
jgi:hypothetical protein